MSLDINNGLSEGGLITTNRGEGYFTIYSPGETEEEEGRVSVHNDLVEGKTGRVTVSNMNFATSKAVLKFIYTGKLTGFRRRNNGRLVPSKHVYDALQDIGAISLSETRFFLTLIFLI